MATKPQQTAAENNQSKTDGKGQSGAGSDTAAARNTAGQGQTSDNKPTPSNTTVSDNQRTVAESRDTSDVTGDRPSVRDDANVDSARRVSENQVTSDPNANTEGFNESNDEAHSKGIDEANHEDKPQRDASPKAKEQVTATRADAPDVDVAVDNERDPVTRFDTEELDKRQVEAEGNVVPGDEAKHTPTVGNPNGVNPRHNSKKNDPYGIDGDGHIENAKEVHEELKNSKA